jgi:CubicO group peptidase (beta-lactamase class C family)
MTKLMTSVAAMQVVEKGLVGLDDDLGAILPELGDRKILTSFDEETKTASFTKPTNKITMR